MGTKLSLSEQARKPVTAALVVIGNEILSGKVKEQNSRFLARELFLMGWVLKEVAIIPDDRNCIVETLRRLAPTHDHLFTSGGVGPTHDDVTLDAVAQAVEREIVVSPVLELLLKKFYGVELLSPSQTRLAMVIEGSTLHYGTSSMYPQIMVDNIYPLPGIPDLFRQKFRELKELWPVEEPCLRRCFHLQTEETQVADFLGQIDTEFPEVNLGSYPSRRGNVWSLELVLESRNSEQLTQASQQIVDELKALEVVEVLEDS